MVCQISGSADCKMSMNGLECWDGGDTGIIFRLRLRARMAPCEREAASGKVSPACRGCLTADGFRDAIDKHKIKTVISFWDEDPDPTLHNSRFDATAIKESDLCKSLGVDYKFIFVKLLPDDPASAVKQFLKVMDDEN